MNKDLNIAKDIFEPLTKTSPLADEIILTGYDRLYDLPGEFSTVKCRTCGLMRTNPRPTPDTIGYYYPDDYGPYLGTKVQKTRSASGLKKIFKPAANRIFDSKSQALPIMHPGKMLEIGCASGGFLHDMAAQGWQVEGVEFSAKAALAASSLRYKVHSGSLESAPEPSGSLDLIVGWMVMEHLHDPIGRLKKLSEWASQDAWLVLSVPNVDTFVFSLFRAKWYDLHLPNHLYHFSPKSLNNILEAGGWSLEKVHHQRTLISLMVSAAYAAKDNGWLRLGNTLHDFAMRGGKWFYIFFPIAWVFSLFGQTGRMTVWARKK